MEATLQRNKPQKSRQKSKRSMCEGENKQKSCSTSKKISEEETILKENLKVLQIVHDSEIKPVNAVEMQSLKIIPEENLNNSFVCDNDNNTSKQMHKNIIPVIDTTEKSRHNEDKCSDVGNTHTEVENLANEKTAKHMYTFENVKYPTIEPFSSEREKLSLITCKDKGVVKDVPIVRYPDLKSLQNCEKIHNIVSSQVLVQTFINKYQIKVATEANKGYESFVKDIYDIDQHPLMDMVHQYHRAKKSCSSLNSRIRYLKSDLKRKKDTLWKTVKKDATAKGKCQDGYSVNVKHVFSIKELDELKFSELKAILKEIEQSLLSCAFYSYSEELIKLRIEHYMCNIMHEEKKSKGNAKSLPNVQMSVNGQEADSHALKKCISVLFDSQRQNVEDRHYLNTCQKWLTMLVSSLNQNPDFENNLFLLNHVIRCPGGIENWASQLIQVPINNCKKTTENKVFECICTERLLLALFLILSPVPFRDHFLRNIRNISLTDAIDKFAVLDSDGEEEETLEMSKSWSDSDIVSLLRQIPIRSLFKHILLDEQDNTEYGIKMQSENRLLKLFAFSTAMIDILCMGLETYYSENFSSLFESISNLIRHILLYISEYYTHHVNMNSAFKSEIQAVYDKMFFHVVYKIFNFKKLQVLKILPALPYNHISVKMLWNILWIFVHPGKLEEEVYSEKDVEVKIKDECIQSHFLKYIKIFPTEDILHVLNTLEKLIISSNGEDDFVKFITFLLFKITILEPELRKKLSNEGSIILSSVCEIYPYLISILLQEINDDEVANVCLHLFKKVNLSNFIPEDSDINRLSSWLLSNVTGQRNYLARLILKKMNFGFNKEGVLFLPQDLHRKIALLIIEAYLYFDSNNNNEGLISKGVKQMLQFTALGNYVGEREDFSHFAWNILFCLKLHPLDRKYPPLFEVYDGSIQECDSVDLTANFDSLKSAYECKHPVGCYLMIVMTNEGCSMKNLLKVGMDCLDTLVENEEYMAAINSLYYILPFFVKHSEELLNRFGFLKAVHSLITADLTVMSNITREPVIGAVLHRVAAMMKYQIYKAGENTIEFSAPLLKLWIKILLKLLFPSDKNSAYMSKNSAKQIYFLLDVLVKISFVHDYTRICILELFESYCSPHLLTKTNQPSLLKRLFSIDLSMYPILKLSTLPEYPTLAWYVLFSEMKQKNLQDLWLKVQAEMLKQHERDIKKISDALKVDLEILPIFRWGLQAVGTPVSHAILPLFYHQFFLYYFHRVPVANSESCLIFGLHYFKRGPFATLLRKIKQHIAEAENYYRNLIKLHANKASSEQKDSKSAECPKNNWDNGYMLHINLLKLFEAFQLWIDDESLLHPKLCLSALEPKYCVNRLELILNGDKTVWTDLVSVASLKDEIDQKVHSYCFNKIVNNVNKTGVAACINPDETLPTKMIRHLDNYETILPAVCIDSEPTVVTTLAYEETNMAFTKKAIIQLIEQNQSIIFDKAKFFCKQMERLKQLNFNYINLTPQEYIVEPSEISEMKVCYKGNECSGAAFFKLQIQKCTRNLRIAEKIENNRADYLLVHDQLSKLPLKDLCIASMRIENYIRCLSKKMKEATAANADYLRNIGVALFYHQIRTIDRTLASVADYPPSRQFFSSIIESLGEEFIDGDESELMELAKSILKHPESGSLALPLFNPNNSSLQCFINVYETLTSFLTKECANTLLALFSKIDFSQWLNGNTPNFDYRKKIFKSICDALLVCGSSPVPELLPVFEIIKKHFRIILQYMFPDLFPEAVLFLLNGMEKKNLSVHIFYEAFHCFGCPLFDDKTSINDIESTLRKFAENQHLPADQQIFISVAQLNLQQVKQVSNLLYNHFMKKRILKKEGFYNCYSSYIRPVGIFIAIINHSLVSLQLDEVSNLKERLNLSDLWDIFHLSFLPWIHPVENVSGLDFPWTNEEFSLASYMLKIFVLCVKYFHEKILTHGCEESVLSFLWNFYIKIYVVPGYRHYSVSVIHTEMQNLNWQQFYPSTMDIEGMCKVLQSSLQESKEFLSNISMKIPWVDVMQKISVTKPSHYVAKVLATLGKLLIISQLQSSKEPQTNLCTNIFKEFEGFSWSFLSIEDIEVLLSLFYDKLDPILLFNNFHNCPEFQVLEFLKLICCIVPNPANVAKEFSNAKRILYLKKYLSAICVCCVSKKTEVLKLIKVLKEIISVLLREIEEAICNGVSSNEQTNYALPLMKEFAIFLNNIQEGRLDKAVADSIISYISTNKQSPLLLPCLKVSSCNLQSVSLMVPLIECCISTRFVDESPDAYETCTTWQLISSYFSVPSNASDVFVRTCVDANAYLTLYCYVLHKLPHCDSVEKKKRMLESIVQWIRESEVRLEAEAKILLLWDKLLELSVKLILEMEYMVVKHELMAFSWILETLAEDRSSSGFFAIVGFGQVSPLSVNFRFLCRVMAAFIQRQILDDCTIRMESMPLHLASNSTNVKGKECMEDTMTSSSAMKALNNLKALEQKKLYSALISQINYAVECVSSVKYTLRESRELLKYFALVLYPKDSYLAALDS